MRYGEQFANAGLWEGSLFVFDERQRVDFGDDVTVLGRCERCAAPTQYHNCANPACRALILLCEDCATRDASDACGAHHANAARQGRQDVADAVTAFTREGGDGCVSRRDALAVTSCAPRRTY